MRVPHHSVQCIDVQIIHTHDHQVLVQQQQSCRVYWHANFMLPSEATLAHSNDNQVLEYFSFLNTSITSVPACLSANSGKQSSCKKGLKLYCHQSSMEAQFNLIKSVIAHTQ